MDKVKERISKLGDSFRQIIQIEAQRERRGGIEKKKRTWKRIKGKPCGVVRWSKICVKRVQEVKESRRKIEWNKRKN